MALTLLAERRCVYVALSHSVLIEQWIRAKYERKEFLDSGRQSYISGHKDGTLWKRGKASSKFAVRRFVLSEANNSLIYFNKSHVSIRCFCSLM